MSRFLFYSIVIALALIGWFTSESSERVAVLFTWITACFSYEGYRYNKEKFRLELFEKRWEVYKNLHELLTTMGMVGSLKEPYYKGFELNKVVNSMEAAENSIWGLGLNQQEFLFGYGNKELAMLLRDASLIAAKMATSHYYNDKHQEQTNDMKWCREVLEKLYDFYTPYLYFGDYKNEPELKNLCDLRVLCGEEIEKIKGFFTCSPKKESDTFQ